MTQQAVTHINAYATDLAEAKNALDLAQARFDSAKSAFEERGGNVDDVIVPEEFPTGEPTDEPKADEKPAAKPAKKSTSKPAGGKARQSQTADRPRQAAKPGSGKASTQDSVKVGKSDEDKAADSKAEDKEGQ